MSHKHIMKKAAKSLEKDAKHYKKEMKEEKTEMKEAAKGAKIMKSMAKKSHEY